MLDQAGELTNKRTTMAMEKNVYNTEKAMSFCTKQKKKRHHNLDLESILSSVNLSDIT